MALLVPFLVPGSASAGAPPCGPGDHARYLAQDGPAGNPNDDDGGRGVAFITEGRRAQTGETVGDILSTAAQECPPGSQAVTP